MLGDQEELDLVKNLNTKNDLSLREQLGLSHVDHRAVYVDQKIYSEVSRQKVLPKTDVYIASGKIDISEFEDGIIKDSQIHGQLVPLEGFGISVKIESSKSYTITKMTPNTFCSVFGSYELGAGISIYCSKEEEFIKNIKLIDGRKTTPESFITFYKKLGIACDEDLFGQVTQDTKDILKSIKRLANDTAREIIDTHKEVNDFIFTGRGAFESPYYCSWLYHHGRFTQHMSQSYQITTGSGRSKGTYTVVIKPSTK